MITSKLPAKKVLHHYIPRIKRVTYAFVRTHFTHTAYIFFKFLFICSRFVQSKRHRKKGIVVPEVPSESIFNMDPTESIFGTDQNDNKFSTDALTADSDSKQLSVEPKKSLDGTTK